MKLDDIIPYIENINDVDVAKTILEMESDPKGYYDRLYDEINLGLKNNISEKKLQEMFQNYEKNMAIKHFQYSIKILDEIKGDKIHSLFHKVPFLNAIYNVDDIYTLRKYLELLNKKLKDADIDYKKYVPIYKI